MIKGRIGDVHASGKARGSRLRTAGADMKRGGRGDTIAVKAAKRETLV
jgi:hypothetical protein